MRTIYLILCVSGWIWFGLVTILLGAHWWWQRKRRLERAAQGFGVVEKHEKQS